MAVTGETKMWLDEREARELAEREVVRLKGDLASLNAMWERTESRLLAKLTEQSAHAEAERDRVGTWQALSGVLSAAVVALVYVLLRR